jgi:hypothetical protein
LSVVPRQRPAGAGKVVHRSARCDLRVSPIKRERCFALLAAGGDVWACVLELNAIRRQRGAWPIASYQALCRELSSAGPGCFGELSSVAARSVLRRYSDAFFSAAKARRAGDASVRYPRRRRHLMSLGFYAGTFSLEGRRLTLPVARGAPPLVVSLKRAVPYEMSQVRSVTLGQCAGRLFLEVTAEVPVQANDGDPARVAGVDLGIIHPYAVATTSEALLVSGRALRAERAGSTSPTREQGPRRRQAAPISHLCRHRRKHLRSVNLAATMRGSVALSSGHRWECAVALPCAERRIGRVRIASGLRLQSCPNSQILSLARPRQGCAGRWNSGRPWTRLRRESWTTAFSEAQSQRPGACR